jgi:hypothetical protein
MQRVGDTILKDMKDFYCPTNVYNFTKSYYSEMTALNSTSSMRTDNTENKVCLQGSCCGPGYWNFLYNSLLYLNFAKWTRTTAFTDDLLITLEPAAVAEVKNFKNMEMTEITKYLNIYIYIYQGPKNQKLF